MGPTRSRRSRRRSLARSPTRLHSYRSHILHFCNASDAVATSKFTFEGAKRIRLDVAKRT